MGKRKVEGRERQSDLHTHRHFLLSFGNKWRHVTAKIGVYVCVCGSSFSTNPAPRDNRSGGSSHELECPF